MPCQFILAVQRKHMKFPIKTYLILIILNVKYSHARKKRFIYDVVFYDGFYCYKTWNTIFIIIHVQHIKFIILFSTYNFLSRLFLT